MNRVLSGDVGRGVVADETTVVLPHEVEQGRGKKNKQLS
jgi:hypothetical protein